MSPCWLMNNNSAPRVSSTPIAISVYTITVRYR